MLHIKVGLSILFLSLITSFAGVGNLVMQPTYPSPPFDLFYSPDGSKIAAVADRLFRIWNTATGAVLLDFPSMNTTYVQDASWSPDNRKIATVSGDQLLRVWNVSDPGYTPGQLLASFQPFPNFPDLLKSVEWSQDGQTIATSAISDGYSFKIWNATTYQLTSQFALGWVETFGRHPNVSKQSVAVGGSGGAGIFTLSSPPTLADVGRTVTVNTLAWNADGIKLAFGYDDGVVDVWNTSAKTQLVSMSALDSNRIHQIAWSPDGRMIASANGAVRIWDSATGQLISTVSGASSIAVAFSPDGSKLAYANGGGAIQIVNAPTDPVVLITVPPRDNATVANPPSNNCGDARFNYMSTVVFPTLATRFPTPTATPTP